MNRNSIFPVTANPQAHTCRTSNNLHQNGGDGRNRTDDPLLAKQVLYQLSYIPSLTILSLDRSAKGTATKLMVGQGGLEPPTPRLSSVCSNQLSY